MRLALAAAIVFALTAAVACGGDDTGDSTSPTTTRTAATTATTTATPSPAPSTPHVDVTGTIGRPTVTPDRGIAPGDDVMGDQKLYLSLGDSLAEGRGASDAKYTAWVPLVAYGLGAEYELVNMGVAGDDSRELIDRRLNNAVAEIQARANDGVPGNEASVITLEIGGNDLLDIYFDLVLPGTCPSVTEALQIPQCVQALEGALENYQPNLEYILDTLQANAPGVPIFLMTLYNPFSGGSVNLDRIGALALEGETDTPFEEGLNDVIREVGAAKGATVVEWYEYFLGKVNEYISGDLIHPNDNGHQVMADAVLAAMAAQGIP